MNVRPSEKSASARVALHSVPRMQWSTSSRRVAGPHRAAETPKSASSAKRVNGLFQQTLFTILLLLSFAAGCNEQPVINPNPVTSGAKTNADREDDLQNALRYVRLVNEYDYDKASEKALSSLNSWLASLKEETPFKVDPLRDRLPKELNPFFPVETLTENKFRVDDYAPLRQYLPAPPIQPQIAMGVRSSDFRYLHETHLLQRIADWAVKQPADLQTEEWLAEKSKSLDERSARMLRDSARLFDWTVRHLQLEKPPGPPKDTAGPTTPGASDQDNLPPALKGAGGPGYSAFPSHSLLTGRADFLQRAWIFCLLARQAKCDVVMLAFENPQTSRFDPWACGAIIADQIYLFDTKLGLPIPLADDKGIATLAQIQADDSLVRRLDLGEDMPYPANKEKLQRVVALIEVSDPALSKRMSLLEARLTGEDEMILAVRPSEIAEALRKAGVSQVYPWRIAYDTILFRAFVDKMLRVDFNFFMQYLTFETPFLRPSPLFVARYKHLDGDFMGDGDENLGAIGDYMNSRKANIEIAQLEYTQEGQALLSMKMMGDRELTDENKIQMLNAQKNALALGKLHATYFMGQVQYDRGAFPISQEWFQKRTIEDMPDTPWTPSAKYNLARSLEMQKKYREARAIYLADQSEQKQGNLLRARRLKPLADAQPETTPQ
jgi:hypothetical protein